MASAYNAAHRQFVYRRQTIFGKIYIAMKLDIDKLTEEELIDLNNRIVARLRFIHQFRAHSKMLEFSIGDRVSFQPEGQPELTGILTRYNKKTVTVITDSGQQWNVAPIFLRKVDATFTASANPSNILHLTKR